MAVATDPACPMCGETKWEAFEHGVNLRPDDPRYIRGGGTNVLAYMCARCQFVRLQGSSEPPDFAKPS
jgi:rubredoxin